MLIDMLVYFLVAVVIALLLTYIVSLVEIIKENREDREFMKDFYIKEMSERYDTKGIKEIFDGVNKNTK